MLDLHQDPHGISQHEPGAKLDAGKPRMGLVLRDFGLALSEVSKVGTFGAAKYSEHGWLSVPNGEERYIDAAFRHLLDQDEQDGESGLHHLAHAAWNVLAALELHLRNERNTDGNHRCASVFDQTTDQAEP